MKKGHYLRNLESVAVLIAMAGLALQLLDKSIPQLIMLGLLTVAFCYLLMGLLTQGPYMDYFPIAIEHALNPWHQKIILITGLGMSVSAIAILFRLMHWEGWQMQMMVGLGSSTFAIILNVLFMRRREPKLFQYLGYRALMLIVMQFILMESSL
jgi:hypothetical protein